MKIKTICLHCNKERFVSPKMIYFIKTGRSSGKCLNCSMLNNKRRLGFKYIMSEATKEKIGSALRGRPLNFTVWNKGLKGYSTSLKGQKRPLSFGIKVSKTRKELFSKGLLLPWNTGNIGFMSGEKHYRWKNDRSIQAIKRRMHGWLSWKKWRKAIFERDKYKCQECGYMGYLEPHHIQPLKETLSRAFDINNGITLCRPCHKLTMGKENQFAKMYFSLLNI